MTDFRDELPVDSDDIARATPGTKTRWAGIPISAECEKSKIFRPARRYVKRIETLLGIDCCLISVGAGRVETVMLRNPFR